MLDQFITQLAASKHLTEEQIRLAVAQLVEESVPAATKASFLSHLAKKGETTDEIAAFVREMRTRAVQPVIDGDLRQH